ASATVFSMKPARALSNSLMTFSWYWRPPRRTGAVHHPADLAQQVVVLGEPGVVEAEVQVLESVISTPPVRQGLALGDEQEVVQTRRHALGDRVAARVAAAAVGKA